MSARLVTFKPTVLALSLAAAFVGQAALAQGLPSGGTAIHGTAKLDTSQANKLLVTTTNGAGTSHSAINWQSFNIGAGNTTQINQPSAASTSINRVVTNTPSALFGNLSSNGRVVLVNQAGITIGAGAYVDTAGFTASVVGMSEANAKAGRLKFDSNVLNGGGDFGTLSTLNVQGTIIARGGDVVLIAPSIELAKTAVVEAQGGAVMLAAGQSVEVTGRGLEGITMQVQAPTDTAINLGTLKGDAVGIFAGTLKHSGLIQANLITGEGGKVLLKASGDAYVEGNARIDSTGSTGKGGSVDVLGQRVAVTDNALIDVSGQAGGGGIRIGGDYQGKNASVQNADYSYLGPNAVLKADALQNGNGGRVIVWSDDTTRAHGSISVRGGEGGGDGGFVETSGHNALIATRAPDLAAPHGKGGTWLLDPSDISISHATGPADVQITAGSPFTPTQSDSSSSGLTDFTISAALASGDVVITTASSGTGTGQIIFNGVLGTVLIQSPVSAARNLTLNATSSVIFLQGNTTFAAGSSGSLTVNVGATSDTFIASGGGVILDGTSGNVTASVSSNRTWYNDGLLQMTGDSQVNLGSLNTGNGLSFYNGTTGTTNVNSTNGFAFYGDSSQLATISNNGIFNVSGNTAIAVAFSQSASGTLNLKNVPLNLQNANDIRGTVDLFPPGATVFSTLYVNEFHGTKATFVGTNFPSVGTLAIGGSVGGSSQASFSGVTAPLTNLAVGSIWGTGVIDFLAGNTVFSSLTVGGGSGVASMTNANVGIKGSNLTIPNVTTYSGSNGFYATGNITLSTAAINGGGVNMTLMASWDGVSALSPSATRTGTAGISLSNNLSIFPGSLTLVAKGNINQSGGFLNVGSLSAFTDGNIALGQNNFVSGDLNVGSSAGGNITFVGTASTFNVGGANTTGNINLTSAGSITSDGSITGNGISLTAPTGFTTIDQVIATGNLTIDTSGSGGTVTQTGASNFTASGTAQFNAGAGDVLLGSATNNFNTVSVAGRHVTLRDTNAMNVTSLAYDGAGNVNLRAGGTLTLPTGAITTTGQVSLISGADITTAGAVSAGLFNSPLTGSQVTFSSGYSGASVLSGNITASGAVALSAANGSLSLQNVTTTAGNIDITAADLTLGGAVNAGAGNVTISAAGSNSIGLGATSSDMTISGAELQNITAANLFLNTGTATAIGTKDIVVDGITAANSANIGKVTLTSSGPGANHDIIFSGGASTFKALDVRANDGVFIRSDITTTTGGMRFDSNFNLAGGYWDEIVTNGDRTLSSAGAINFVNNVLFGSDYPTGSVAGNVTITGQGITFGGGLYIQNGTGKVGNLNALGGNLTVASQAVTSNNSLILAGANVALNGNVTVTSGNLTLTANGSLVQGPGITLTANQLTMSNNGPINLGNLAVNSVDVNTSAGNGAITQAAGTGINASSYANFVSGSGAITLNNVASGGNNFNYLGVTSAGAVSLTNGASPLNFFPISAGSFTLASGGSIGTYNDITTTVGGIDIRTTAGTINLNTDGSASVTSPGGVVLRSTSDLNVSGVDFHVSAGNAIVLGSDSGLLYASGATVLGGARWLTYLPTPLLSHVYGPFAPALADFRQLNAPFGTAPLGTGNGSLFALSPSPLSGSLTGTATKVYDGGSAINMAGTSLAITSGALFGETTGSVSGVGTLLASVNVGSGLATGLSGGSVTALDANGKPTYGYSATASGNVGTVTPAALSTWTASGGGLWSNLSNWSLSPLGGNVLSVTIPAGASVIYDAAAGNTSLQSITSLGSFTLAGGSLAVSDSLRTVQYSQTGGALGGIGSLTVNGSFTQTGGTIDLGGAVDLTQASGNLNLGPIRAASITLAALGGSINQTDAVVTSGLLSTRSLLSTLLNRSSNRVASFKAETASTGNIELTSVGAIDVQGIRAADGNIVLNNIGGISTSGPVLAPKGGVRMTANSPLTIGNDGILASGDISLTATNLTSPGNVILNGNLTSTAGAIALLAAGNLAQNSVVSGALGVSAKAGGSMLFGPLASTNGYPISYLANGATVTPPGSGGNTTLNFLDAFLDKFEEALVAQTTDSTNPLSKKKNKDRDALVVEGETCKP